MLEFEKGYARDQSGVRISARDGRRRVLFRVERQTAIEGLSLQPSTCEPIESLMEDHMVRIWRGCEHAYLDDMNHDNLTIIRVQERHLGYRRRQHQS
jgi:hypothetical protein